MTEAIKHSSEETQGIDIKTGVLKKLLQKTNCVRHKVAFNVIVTSYIWVFMGMNGQVEGIKLMEKYTGQKMGEKKMH